MGVISTVYTLASWLISKYQNEITELGFGAGSNTLILILFQGKGPKNDPKCFRISHHHPFLNIVVF